jgi:hypothetical protein
MKLFPNGPQLHFTARPDATEKLSPESILEQLAYMEHLGLMPSEACRRLKPHCVPAELTATLELTIRG